MDTTANDPQAELEHLANTLIADLVAQGFGPIIAATAHVAWEAGQILMQSDKPSVRRYGLVLALGAVSRTPGVDVAATRVVEIRDALVASDPALALV